MCKACSKNWAFDANGVCQQVSPFCKTSEGLQCTSCFNGYTLNNGVCDLAPLIDVTTTDAGCGDWDWANQVCKSCSAFWYFNSNGQCTPVDTLCKTFDPANGNCLTCYKGYSLNVDTNRCDLTPHSGPSDAGCNDWNWDQQTCNSCGNYWYMNNGVCAQVSPYCKTYENANGQCTSCFSGYQLSNGECVMAPHSLCKSTNENGQCATCYNGYVLVQGECRPLDTISNIALYYAECCPEKLAQLKAEGRIPQ